MERVGADDHPLSTAGRSSLLPTASGRIPNQAGISFSEHRIHYQNRTPSASLIQSAVRSVLDDATPSTVVSDDRSEEGSFVDGDPVASRYSSSPALHSLQIERLPPIPDEQDRKRFIVSSASFGLLQPSLPHTVVSYCIFLRFRWYERAA
jgi:hypothetical protein